MKTVFVALHRNKDGAARPQVRRNRNVERGEQRMSMDTPGQQAAIVAQTGRRLA
jgi:hypothetical protein